jgi:hypothetical protein
MYQQAPQQPQASHSTSSTRLTTSAGGVNAPDLGPSMTLNSAVAVPTEALETKSSDDLGKYTFDLPPDFTFGATNEQGGDLMDFTFDPITTGNENMLTAMQAIQSPNWLGNMLMPRSVDGSPSLSCACRSGVSLHHYRFFWPAEESMQDYSSSMRNDMAVNNYQNF